MDNKQSQLTPQAPQKSKKKTHKSVRFKRVPKLKVAVKKKIRLGRCCGRGSECGDNTCVGTYRGCAVCTACITDTGGKTKRKKVRAQLIAEGYTVHMFVTEDSDNRGHVIVSREE